MSHIRIMGTIDVVLHVCTVCLTSLFSIFSLNKCTLTWKTLALFYVGEMLIYTVYHGTHMVDKERQ
jgi:hypothetical protein